MHRFSGLGSPIPPLRRWGEEAPFLGVSVSAYRNTGGSEPLRTVQQRQHQRARALFQPTFAIEPAGYGMMPRANTGSAVSAVTGSSGLSGLGLVTSSSSVYDDAIASLAEAVRRGVATGLSSDNFLQIKQFVEDETSLLLYKRSAVWPWNATDKVKQVNAYLATVNAELRKAGKSPVAAPPSTDDAIKPPDEMSATAKFAIIGGITVAGIIGIAVITGQVAPLLRAFKR